MKFSVCLSTGFEGVMVPIPFAGPEDFIAEMFSSNQARQMPNWSKPLARSSPDFPDGFFTEKTKRSRNLREI
jgi:hypothetical protein